MVSARSIQLFLLRSWLLVWRRLRCSLLYIKLVAKLVGRRKRMNWLGFVD